MNASTTSARGYVRAVAALAALTWAVSGAAAADGSLAKVTAVQNTVETKAAAATSWSPSSSGQALAAKDRVRTGPASRASILYSDQTLHRVGERSEVEILPPAGTGSGVVNILSGQSYFTTRTPKDFGRVQTPTVTAAIKGTEFGVEVAEGGTTIVTMIEGTVEASNAYGSVTVSGGEQAVAEPGKAPQRRIIVRPRDAVAWSFYYPPVLGGSDLARAKASPGGERLARAASALANGQVDEAQELVNAARSADPKDPVALALASVIALAGDRRDEARTLADAALAADAGSPAAVLARSYVAQADFDLDRARELAEKAASLDPANAEALARAAELRLAQGDYKAARRTAEDAVERAPGNARALAVLGFVELASYRTRQAAEYFDRAVAADSGLALAHAGRGIAKIRQGQVVPGREEIQTAAMLDPAESLYRSYLGKAYYEEKRTKEAAKELQAAKDLDPNDPTPWLYSAIQLQTENRPVEALRDLNGAIERNGNRAVYRSRLLVDEDRAARGADLARIYNDLGFDTLGLVAARRSADQDQANFSSHLFLAGNYRNLPGYAAAFLSETLQSRIYQPVGVNAARPDFVSGTVAFNEYTALFDRPRARGFVDGWYGYTDTHAETYYPANNDCGGFPCVPDESRTWNADLRGTYYRDRLATSLEYRKLRDDGFRTNNERDNSVVTGFVQAAVSDRDTIQLNAIFGQTETGDLPLRQMPFLISPQTFDTDELNIGVGWHRKATAATDIAVSAIYNDTDQTATLLGTPLAASASFDGPQLEAQVVHRSGRSTWVMGGGGFDGDFTAEAVGGSTLEGSESFANLYGYVRIRDLGPIEVTVGLAQEAVDVPVGLLPPRDSNILPSDVTFTDLRWSPKLGVSAFFDTGTTVRAAVFARVASGISRLQTLEPTQVSGFNQFFDDVGGTRSWNYGIGVDQQFASRYFFGLSYMRRDTDVPEAACATPDPFSGCAFQVPTFVADRFKDDDIASAYLNVLLGKMFALSLDYTFEDSNFDTTYISPLGLFQDRVQTQKLRPQGRVFLPCGFYASATGTNYVQEVDQFDDLTSPVRTTQEADFWTLDAAIGYRLPKRLGSVSIEGTNLTDREFVFYDRSVQDTVIPARTVILRVDFVF